MTTNVFIKLFYMSGTLFVDLSVPLSIISSSQNVVMKTYTITQETVNFAEADGKQSCKLMEITALKITIHGLFVFLYSEFGNQLLYQNCSCSFFSV